MGKSIENRVEKNISHAISRRNPIRDLGNSLATQKPNTAAVFFIETLALLAVFTIITVVLVKGFLFAEKLSRNAESLSKAVHLAENTAEMVSASESGEMLFSLLDENGNAYVSEQAEDSSYNVYRAVYDADMNPAVDGVFYVDVSWIPTQNNLVQSTVSVFRNDATEALYSLDLAVYIDRTHK